MKEDQADFLKRVADDEGIEAEIYEGYSGRGMYGRETQGITTDDPIGLLCSAIDYAAHCDQDEVPPMSGGFRQDSMGFDTIIY